MSPFFGEAHTLFADSAFSSVKTLLALAVHGIRFMGMVKTAHREFPMKYLQSWAAGKDNEETPKRGDHILLESESGEGSKLYALGWADRKAKFFVFNAGTTHPVDPSVRVRHKVIVENGEARTMTWEKKVNWPDAVRTYFQNFSVIDIHNHLRQGSLAVEQEWLTHTWWHRVFATIFGICVVDAYLVCKYVLKEEVVPRDVNFTDFINKLAYQLIFNAFLESRNIRQRGDDEQISTGPQTEVCRSCIVMILSPYLTALFWHSRKTIISSARCRCCRSIRIGRQLHSCAASIVIQSVHIIALLAPTLSAVTFSLVVQHIRVGVALSTTSITLHPCDQYEEDSLSFSKIISFNQVSTF
jgi:hypothetical protein